MINHGVETSAKGLRGRAHQEAGIAEGAGLPLARTVWVLWGEAVEGEHMGGCRVSGNGERQEVDAQPEAE